MEKYHDATDESLSGDHSVSVLFIFELLLSLCIPPLLFLFFFILLILPTIIFCFY